MSLLTAPDHIPQTLFLTKLGEAMFWQFYPVLIVLYWMIGIMLYVFVMECLQQLSERFVEDEK